MKIKKLLIAFLAIFMITATGAGLAFAETGTERNSAQTETAEIVFADGAFKGVKYNGETAGGVYLGVKEGTVGRSEFLRLTAKFAEGINPNESTDLFITMGMPDFGGAFRLVVEDSEGGIWRMSHGATENFPFILDDGTVSTVKMSGNNYTFVAGKTGTLSVPWAKTFSAINSSGNFLTEGRKIVSVSICLTLGARSGGALWYSGLGVNFYALGTVKRGADAETSEVKTLINANDCTFTADAEDTTADVNVAAVDKGKVFAIDGGLVNLSSVVKSGDENYDAIIAYGQIGRGDGLLTVNYKDKNGNAIKATDKTKVAYDMANGYYAYEITAPEISDYEYESADKELIGSFSTVTEEITLTYKASEVPDTDWDESTDNDVYKATFDENGFIKALDVKGDIDNCVYVGLKKNMTAASGMFSLVTVKLGEGADTSKSAGMFVKFILPRNGYGFHFIVKDTAGNYYTAHKLNAGKDIFTIENAEEGVSLNASTQFKFKADAGTWFIPWECFSSLSDNGAMPADTIVESASFALNLANSAWFGGYGVRFVAAGTVKTGINKSKLVVLSDGATATYADSADDTTKDVNVIDVTKGRLFYSNEAFNGSAILTSGDLYETAVNNVEAAVYPKMMPATLTVKYVDSNGTEIKESYMEKVDYDKADGKYKYAITAPVIYDYDYVSADHALEGEFTETSFTVTLSYKLSEVPDTDWDENLDNDLYSATFNGDKLETFHVKKDIGKSVIFSIKKDLEDYDGLFSLFSVNLKNGAEVSKSSGLFVKLECSRNNYGFKFIITDENGRHYVGYGAKAVGKDLCTMEDGETTLSITSETQNVFFGKAGTWYVPWESFTDLETGAALDPSAKIVSCDIAMNLTKKAWFGGVGVKIAAVGTAKVGKGKMKAEVLADGTAATFTEDATDETKDVNIADVTKGQVFYSRSAFYKNQIVTEGEEPAFAISAVELTPPSAEITLRMVDEKGRSIADDRVVLAVIGKSCTITPPTVMGYEYVSAIPSLTFDVTESTAVTLKYKPKEMTIIVKFVDIEGNEIAESKSVKCAYKGIYTVAADEISGYVFVESSRKLTGTCMADMTITLTYEKAGGCHGGLESTVGSIWLSGLAVLALGAITAISKKKKR